jgi:hypothetical protein
MRFCQEMLKYDADTLNSICFSDESRIVLGHDNQWVWYRRGENNPSANIETAKFPQGVMIFAVIGMNYKSNLLIVDGSIDAEQYRLNCEDLHFIEELDNLRGPLNWIFQQDGAPCHMAQKTLDWLEECCDVLHGWPANSPDLSPIELLWAILKKIVSRLNPNTLDDLREHLKYAWASIPMTTINRLCGSFRKRLTMCFNNQGQSISNDLWSLADQSVLSDFALQHQGPYFRWTEEEDNQLIDLHLLLGSNWKKLALYFENRTSESIKNRWHSVIKFQQRDKISNTEWMLERRRQAREHYLTPNLRIESVRQSSN